MKHGFVGYLAGLSVLVGALESPRVLSCLTRCQEALDTPAMELLQPSMELLTNNGECSSLIFYARYKYRTCIRYLCCHPSASK